MSQAATLAGASAEAQRTLAEAMFAYIDQLAAESVEGYTEAQLAEASDVERRPGDPVRDLDRQPTA